MIRCAGFKADGTPCAVTVEKGQGGFCWWHDPANAEERRRAASKGGRAKANPLTRELHGQLEKLTDDVIAGRLQPYRGAVACQLINGRIRLMETERRAREQEDLIERLDELERNRGAGRGAGSWGA